MDPIVRNESGEATFFFISQLFISKNHSTEITIESLLLEKLFESLFWI